jgi:hypothetical protein
METVGDEAVSMTKDAHATPILDATVLSDSSFSLFFSNACWRQLSRLLHAWCSGSRCCEVTHMLGTRPCNSENRTHCSTELHATMWALSDDAEDGGVATSFLELAALLGRHRVLVINWSTAGETAVCLNTRNETYR